MWLPAIFVVKYQQIQVPHLVHRSPCEFGKETSAWALDLVAKVSHIADNLHLLLTNRTMRASAHAFTTSSTARRGLRSPACVE